MFWRFFMIVYENNEAELKWSYLIPDDQSREINSIKSEFCVELVKETKTGIETLLRKNVELLRDKYENIKNVKTNRLGTIFAEVPFNPQTTDIRILRDDIQLLRIPVLHETPSVKLNSRKVTPKGKQEISWSAKTKERCPLWFSVFAELDGKRHPISSKIHKSNTRIWFDKLPGCKQGRIVVRACSGFYIAEDMTEYFSLPFKPPNAYIMYPPDGEHIQFGQPIQLRGQGFDVQSNKFLLGDALNWSIDDHTVGKGRLCTVPELKIGKHSIVLRVTDFYGNKGENKISIIVKRKRK